MLLPIDMDKMRTQCADVSFGFRFCCAEVDIRFTCSSLEEAHKRAVQDAKDLTIPLKTKEYYFSLPISYRDVVPPLPGLKNRCKA